VRFKLTNFQLQTSDLFDLNPYDEPNGKALKEQ